MKVFAPMLLGCLVVMTACGSGNAAGPSLSGNWQAVLTNTATKAMKSESGFFVQTGNSLAGSVLLTGGTACPGVGSAQGQLSGLNVAIARRLHDERELLDFGFTLWRYSSWDVDRESSASVSRQFPGNVHVHEDGWSCLSLQRHDRTGTEQRWNYNNSYGKHDVDGCAVLQHRHYWRTNKRNLCGLQSAFIRGDCAGTIPGDGHH
jgi:hypothetical protein